MPLCVACETCCCHFYEKGIDVCKSRKKAVQATWSRLINTHYSGHARKDPVCDRCKERDLDSIPNSFDCIDGYEKIN